MVKSQRALDDEAETLALLKQRCRNEAVSSSQRVYLLRLESGAFQLEKAADYKRLQRQEEVVGTGLPDGDWREGK